MPELKGISTDSVPHLALQQCDQLRRVDINSISSNDDIDTCTMEEARKLLL